MQHLRDTVRMKLVEWVKWLTAKFRDGKRSFLSTSAAGEISYLNPCCPSAYRRGLSISKFLLARLAERRR